MNYYIIWINYDGTYIETFEKKEKAEERIGEILHIKGKEDYGTDIQAVIKGIPYTWDIVKYVNGVKLQEFIDKK